MDLRPGPGDYTPCAQSSDVPKATIAKASRWQLGQSEGLEPGPASYWNTRRAEQEFQVVARRQPGQPRFSAVPRSFTNSQLSPGPGDYTSQKPRVGSCQGTFSTSRRWIPDIHGAKPGPASYWSTRRDWKESSVVARKPPGQPPFSSVPRQLGALPR
mmetsp:Transcript_116948/g.261502  ORF Transcript_116948/g.261502 Transcript_116948/m.261502 type:complete len:157 (+) Transcript_116948:305-775(+)